MLGRRKGGPLYLALPCRCGPGTAPATPPGLRSVRAYMGKWRQWRWRGLAARLAYLT